MMLGGGAGPGGPAYIQLAVLFGLDSDYQFEEEAFSALRSSRTWVAIWLRI
jgi:hypothetical protein